MFKLALASEQPKAMAIQTHINQSLSSVFIKQYKKNEYASLARAVANMCQQALSKNGIPHKTQSRAKEPESLRKKIEQRERKNGRYKTLEDVHHDIVDLAGARIILERWEDRHFVKEIINETFKVQKEEPKNEKSGYEAVHYRVHSKQNGWQCGPHTTEEEPLVEIQVQSWYMAQWASVEHDAQYKTSKGPSQAMSNSLDLWLQLSKLTESLAEQTKAFKTKQDAKDKRKFRGRKHIGNHLDKWFSDDDENVADWARNQKEMGSSTALEIYLDARGWKTPGSLNRLLYEHFGAEAQDEYSNVAAKYAGIDLNRVIYLMDRVVLNCGENCSGAFEIPNNHEVHAYKIQVILSTFIWMNRLFLPTYGWQRLFTRIEDQKTVREGILLLGMSARQNFAEESSLADDEVSKLNRLWDWFFESRDRPIMLAFTMSNQGAIRDVPKEKTDLRNALRPLIAALGRGLA
ncbi:RelA/SpoT [Penicillium cf. viridicatum]|uniref:RelA/SpoT n=1 Tax=Penicillium cf. viridicatum TaxID=2972119 RepID=A0A9W9MBV6_9EURO|nr:RelA/SpoT [Penicillium cf. viridicatum]